jgi:putative restriction endonuclease
MKWTREHQLVALHLYLTQPFGQLDDGNKLIQSLAKAMGRTSGSLNMKANNFASLDPEFLATGRKGLPGASKADETLWAEYAMTPVALRAEMDEAVEKFHGAPAIEEEVEPPLPVGASEGVSLVKVRRHQRFFRNAVSAAYGLRCAVTDLDVAELNIASHIIPWSLNVERRSDPTNGILLSALFDRAFDRGLVSVEGTKLRCSKAIEGKNPARRLLLDYDGQSIRIPERTPPDPVALRWHWEHCFLDNRPAPSRRKHPRSPRG